jgi:nicotinamide-nucleotide amidase
MKKLGKDFFDEPFDFGIYPSSGEVMIRILADRASVLRRLRKKIATRLSDRIYAWNDEPFSAVVGKILTKKKKTLAVAESCTGGLLASWITAQAGASAFFRGGTVAYHSLVKKKLGVSGEAILDDGEVSSQVASQLARAIRDKMEASYGIGITGIAGPGGGSAKKPVGLVYIGLASSDGKARAWKHVFWGERRQIQTRAAMKALEYLWRKIR